MIHRLFMLTSATWCQVLNNIVLFYTKITLSRQVALYSKNVHLTSSHLSHIGSIHEKNKYIFYHGSTDKVGVIIMCD